MALLSCALLGFVVLVTGTLGLNYPVRPKKAVARRGMAAMGPVGPSILSLRSPDFHARFAGDLLSVICG
jgi:hypothetical protein